MDQFIIDISESIKDFRHLLESDNRVILSSGFGGGKTYFINEFKKKYSADYYFITLYPVNYVISDNQSILEYIKRDICFQLARDFYINASQFDMKGFLFDLKDDINFQELIQLLSTIPPVAALGFTTKIANSIHPCKCNILKKINNNTYSSGKYIKSFEKNGSAYDNDVYTKFIQRILDSFRKYDHKKTVLIIEDMDRIDPGHIFNILNVFGSHIDRHFIDSTDSTHNKFGFDKLITVMSYENCQRLYENKYGEDVDFDGYIAKFISSKPFKYSITSSARNMLAQKLYSLLELADDDKDILTDIYGKLNKFSVRDIERIYLFDPDKIIKPQLFFDIHGLKVSRNCNLLKIYAYSVMYDISLLGYDQFHFYKNQYSSAQLFIPLYILCKGEVRNFIIDKQFYSVEQEYDENKCIVSLKVKKSMSVSSPWFKMTDFEETLHLYREQRAIAECYYSYSNETEDIDSTND